MKDLYFLIIAILIVTTISGQNIADGMRYAKQTNLGDARFSSMSGAMNALGGNLSAMEKNPAGGAVFSNSYAGFTTSLTGSNKNLDYFGTQTKNKQTIFDFNQAAGIFVLHNDNESASFRKLAIGASFNISNNFSNDSYFKGIGRKSIADFFLNQAQGLPLEYLDLRSGESISDLYSYLGENFGSGPQTAFLGYQAYLFDPINPEDPANTAYVPNVFGERFNQQLLTATNGSQAKFTINISARIEDNFYLGMNVNTHSIDYREHRSFIETNSHPESSITAIGYEDNLVVYGTGVSAQLGGIATIGNHFRVGLTYDTPTYFRISEETSQLLESNRLIDGNTRHIVVNPRIINIYEEYKLRTPGKIGLGVAYVFNQSGLVSFDYDYKNYAGMRFSPKKDPYFSELNTNISNTLTASSSFRLGGEYRLNAVSFRGGLRYEQSPFKNKDELDDLIGFSLGTGYSIPNFRIDFSFSHASQKGETQPFSTGLTDRVSNDLKQNHFILSLGFAL